VQGFLSVPEREYDLVKTADVFNHFLTSRPTPLIPSIVGSSQPFYSAAAKGLALRAFLPGMPVGDTNIIKKAYIDLDIPVATATLLNPLSGARLQQYMNIELKNPFDATLYVFGLEVPPPPSLPLALTRSLARFLVRSLTRALAFSPPPFFRSR